MRQPRSMAVALWVLEHLACGPYTEAISGDLLEALGGGASIGWYCRQALWALLWDWRAKARTLAEPLLFSLCWSALYPAWWLLFARAPLTYSALAHWTAHDLLYATSLKVVGEIVPSVVALSLGLVAYLLCHKGLGRIASRRRFVFGLSLGLNVLLVLAVGLSCRSSRPHIGFYDALHTTFSPTHFLALSLVLAGSLFAAILSVLPPRHAHHASVATD